MNLDERTFTIVSASEYFDLLDKKEISNSMESCNEFGITTGVITDNRKFLVVNDEILKEMNIGDIY